MQIGSSNKITEKFIDYGTAIRIESEYKKIIVLAFILKTSLKSGRNGTSIVDFQKYNFAKQKIIREYDKIKIYEIDSTFAII